MEDLILTEMDEMKQQIALLKKKLDSQTIVNERLMDRAMRSNLSVLNRRAWVLGSMGVLAMPYCWWVFTKFHFSTAFAAATVVFLAISIVATWLQHRGVTPSELMRLDLLTVAARMQRLRKNYLDWLKFSIPALLCWLCWFVVEGLRMDDNSLIVPFVVGGSVGAAVGAAVGVTYLRRTLRTIREVLRQIEELREMER